MHFSNLLEGVLSFLDINGTTELLHEDGGQETDQTGLGGVTLSGSLDVSALFLFINHGEIGDSVGFLGFSGPGFLLLSHF